MSLKPLIFTLACFGASCIGLAQDTQTFPNERGIYDSLWKKLDPPDHCPDVPIDVLFFDINHDGIPDALVSYREDQCGGGCHGNDWDLWQYKDGEWQKSPYKKLDEYTYDPSNSVYARGDDFYSLTQDGQKPKLILAYTSVYKDWEDDLLVFKFRQSACEITIDDEGYLKTIPIPELTVDVEATQNEAENVLVIPDLGEEYDALNKLLVPLSIETSFLHNPKDGKPPPAVTAEQEGVAQVSSSTREGEEKLGIGDKESRIEKQETPNRLWLYLTILPCILVILYLMWRKKE